MPTNPADASPSQPTQSDDTWELRQKLQLAVCALNEGRDSTFVRLISHLQTMRRHITGLPERLQRLWSKLHGIAVMKFASLALAGLAGTACTSNSHDEPRDAYAGPPVLRDFVLTNALGDPLDLAVFSESGSSATVYAVLQSQPDRDHQIDFSVHDIDSSFEMSPSSLTFTRANWNQPQAITISATNDDLSQGDQLGSLEGQSEGSVINSLPVLRKDDEDPTQHALGDYELTSSVPANGALHFTAENRSQRIIINGERLSSFLTIDASCAGEIDPAITLSEEHFSFMPGSAHNTWELHIDLDPSVLDRTSFGRIILSKSLPELPDSSSDLPSPPSPPSLLEIDLIYQEDPESPAYQTADN